MTSGKNMESTNSTGTQFPGIDENEGYPKSLFLSDLIMETIVEAAHFVAEGPECTAHRDQVNACMDDYMEAPFVELTEEEAQRARGLVHFVFSLLAKAEARKGDDDSALIRELSDYLDCEE